MILTGGEYERRRAGGNDAGSAVQYGWFVFAGLCLWVIERNRI